MFRIIRLTAKVVFVDNLDVSVLAHAPLCCCYYCYCLPDVGLEF